MSSQETPPSSPRHAGRSISSPTVTIENEDEGERGNRLSWRRGKKTDRNSSSKWKIGRTMSALTQEYFVLSSKKDNKASIAAAPVAVDNKGFKTPKEVVAALIIIGEAKLMMRKDKMFILGLFGGIYTALGGICAAVAVSGLPGFNAEYPAIPRLIGALLWGVGLTFTIVCGAELFLGNCMTCTIAWLHNFMHDKSTRYNKLLPFNLIVVLITNSLGAVATAYFFGYLTEIFSQEPYLSGVRGLAHGKTAYGFGAAFLRGIACNQLICLGIFMAIAAEDIISKSISCYTVIFTFVFSGYDSSIANMVTVPLSLMYGAPSTFGYFLYRSFIPSFLGNAVGGFLLVGGFYYWVYFKTKRDFELQPAASVSSNL